MSDIQRIFAGALLVLSAATPVVSAEGETLYRWTDAAGRTHFSDRPPATATPPRVEQFAAPSYADSGVPADHYSVTKQLERMQAERLQRERELRDREREAREQALREREVAVAERAARRAEGPGRYGGGAVYPSPRRGYGHPYPGRPHRAPAHRPVKPPSLWEPDHPAYRPYPRHRPLPRTRPVPFMRDGL